MRRMIVFEWKDEKRMVRRLIKRQEMYEYFKKLSEDYPNDNLISLKLLEIIPVVDKIVVDNKANSNRDIPVIKYITGKEENILEIIRYHKIVWGKLEEYSQL